jgi:gas vesicle protein
LIHDNNVAIAKAQGLAERDSAYLRSLLAGWDNGGTLGDMVTEAAGLLTALKSDTAKYKFAYDTLSTYYKQWNEAVKVADSAWNFVNKGKVNVLGKDIENLQEMATLYDSAIADLHERIDSLCDEMDAIKETIKKEVTGIEIQGTINPIYGTFAYPVGLKSYVLATYYGEIDAPVFFPAGDTDGDADFWVGGVAGVLTSELKDIKAPGFGGPAALKLNKGIVMDKTVGNAGTLYVTVNPSNVDFTGKEFSLRSSNNAVSKVVLSDLVATDDVLTWGARRASANGFYKATATISKDVVKDVALSFNFDAIKTEAKGILDNFTSTSAREAVVDVAKLGLAVMNAMPKNVPQLGVQAQWQDTTGWKNYVSKYELAAVSAKPLGYDFLYDVNYADKVVKLKNALIAKEKAYSQELINKIKGMINVTIGMPESAGSIQVVDEADGKHIYLVLPNYNISASGNLPTTIKIGSVTYPCTFTPATLTVNGTATPAQKADITSLFTAISKGIENSLAGINGKASDLINTLLNKVINVENKFFGKLASVAGNPNRFILPAMLASNQSLGYFYPSRNWFTPTLVKAGETIKLYPTSLTGEVVAPAFKKYVAILTGPTAGKNYNTGDLNTVLEGNKYNLSQPIEITLTEKGVYEFIYEALGYNGKISGKKYYIEVY